MVIIAGLLISYRADKSARIGECATYTKDSRITYLESQHAHI